ncbi:SRPBCC family protein [soil metagenome]
MKSSFTAETTISISAPASEVWKAITTPAITKEYLFGTHVKSDWKEGSTISYEGEYQGHTYMDKGTILKVEPNKVFQSTYWSSMGDKEDKPENYNTITYTLTELGNQTQLTITQDNIQTEESRKHSAENWKAVLQKLKELVEKGSNIKGSSDL